MGAGKVRADERVGIVVLGGLGLTGAQELGVREIFEDASELAGLDLAVIVDFAGFGTTTANAIAAVRPAGRVIQGGGLGNSEATIPISQLVLKAVTLRGARGGRPRDFETVIDLIAKGDLSIHATTTTFEEIPQAIERLKNGDVLGRIVAVLD